MGKIIVGKVSDITPGNMSKISVDGHDILVADIDGNFFALYDTFTYAGGSLSEEGWTGQ
jgi:3-phenylpropionate/trans-cinnamate dioxygenase ferredoxin component